MTTPRFEVPSGLIDGANMVFTVSNPYQAGSTAVFINGALMRIDLTDGWTESNPAGGEVTLNEAPRVGPSGSGDPDVIQVFYLDTSPAVIDLEVCERICGTLVASEEICGRLFLCEG